MGTVQWTSTPLRGEHASYSHFMSRKQDIRAVPNAGVFFFSSFTPESVRWLLKKGRVSEAREVLRKVARLNNKHMPVEPLLLPNDEKVERLGDFRDLFISVKMIHKTLASWLMW